MIMNCHGAVICVVRSHPSSGFKLFLQIIVGNRAVDAQVGASLNMTAVHAALASVAVQGSKQSYADLVVTVDRTAAVLEYKSLFSVSVASFVKKSVHHNLQVVMATEMKKQMSMSSSSRQSSDVLCVCPILATQRI